MTKLCRWITSPFRSWSLFGDDKDDSGTPVAPGDAHLLETGDYELLETGDKLLLEA